MGRSILFFCLLLLQAHHSAFAADLTWTGCGITKLAFMEELAAAYEKKSGKSIELTGGGATKGIRGVAAGTYDLGGSCRMRMPLPAEADARMIHIGWDALVVIVNPANEVSNLDRAQIKKVFDGAIDNWSAFGWLDKPIALVTRDGTDSGVGRTFRAMLFGDADYRFKARSLSVKSTGPLEKKIEQFPTAMGIDGVISAQKRNVKILSVEGVAPTKENVIKGAYPFYRPFFLTISSKKPSKEALDFVAFATGPEGQQVISRQGAVNVAEGAGLRADWEQRFGSISR